MSNENEQILTDENYYFGLNKLIVDNPKVWAIMIEENLLEASGDNPTPETYCHLCLLAQKKKSVLKNKSELCVECGQNAKHPIGNPELCQICTGKKMLQSELSKRKSLMYG